MPSFKDLNETLHEWCYVKHGILVHDARLMSLSAM